MKVICLDRSTVRSKKKKFRLDEEFVHIQQTNSQWPHIFDIYFLSPKTRLQQSSSNSTSDDDLIFYVTRHVENDFNHPLVSHR